MAKRIQRKDAPTTNRLMAYAIDWALGGIVSGLPAVLIYGFVTQSNEMFSDLYVFEALGYSKWLALFTGLLCLVFSYLYYVVIPYKKFKGQTIGKKIMKIEIVSQQETPVSLKQLWIHNACILLLECPMYVISRYFLQMITLIIRFQVESVWTFVGIALTIVSSFMVIYTKDHLAIHDRLSKTKVVQSM